MSEKEGDRQNVADGTCIYCGERKASTRDHIPPKCLFDRPHPENMITVPACSECNQGASLDDEYFRNAVVMREDAGEHPAASALWDSKVHPSINRFKAPGSIAPILTDLRLVPKLTPSGIYVTEPRYGVKTVRIERVVARIVKGIFFHAIERRLPNDYAVASIMVGSDCSERHKKLADEIVTLGEAMRPIPWVAIGKLDGTFGYKIGIWSEDENVAHVLMLFYARVLFLGVTHKVSVGDDD